MKTYLFNICPSCKYLKTCVLTSQKSHVWECSEYDENSRIHLNPASQLEMHQRRNINQI